jgi:CheY-like chemotaxis protein
MAKNKTGLTQSSVTSENWKKEISRLSGKTEVRKQGMLKAQRKKNIEESIRHTEEKAEQHTRQAALLHKKLWELTEAITEELIKLRELHRTLSAIREKKAQNERKSKNYPSEGSSTVSKEPENNGHPQSMVPLLVKEVEKLKIIKKLLGSADLYNQGRAESKPEREEHNKAKKVLIVDDDPISSKLIGYFLEKENFSLDSASNGKKGIKRALENPPDIILLDLMMPGLDGFQFLSELKKEEPTSRIPVIILSSLSQEQDILRGLKEGASDYITKPFSPQIVLAIIKKNIASEE